MRGARHTYASRRKNIFDRNVISAKFCPPVSHHGLKLGRGVDGAAS